MVLHLKSRDICMADRHFFRSVALLHCMFTQLGIGFVQSSKEPIRVVRATTPAQCMLTAPLCKLDDAE